jgi:acetylornithine/succinyldiaminopimelate/putrescine aminotransferase
MKSPLVSVVRGKGLLNAIVIQPTKIGNVTVPPLTPLSHSIKALLRLYLDLF